MTTSEKIFLLRWSLVTALAMALLMMTTRTMPPIMAGGFAGLIVGIAQWFLLRQRMSQAYEWIIATTAGFLVTVMAIDRFANVETTSLPPFVYVGLVYVVMGSGIGASQWLVLRRHFAHAGIWIPLCVVGHLLGIGLVLAGTLSNGVLDLLTQVTAATMLGLVIGVMTGAGLVWLMRHPGLATRYEERKAG